MIYYFFELLDEAAPPILVGFGIMLLIRRGCG